MRISVITPTADQPTGIALAERWMRRQTMQPHEWIVADDGITPARLTMGQTHIVRERTAEGGASLAGNVLAALERVTGDVVLIWEHDDWYAPQHVQTCAQRIAAGAGATGSQWQRYYNVEHRCWIVMHNIGSALCNTALRAEHVPALRAAAERALHESRYCVDRFFWDSLPASATDIHQIDTVVGIKGLPGRKGLGMGHRPDKSRRWHPDPRMKKLAGWVGEDVGFYEGLRNEAD